MGIISKGILGGFSGLVGTVVGGTWKGIPYMRSLPTSKRSVFSQPQLAQQAKFSLAVKFLQSMTGLLTVSFSDFAVRMTGFNNALGYTLKNAVTGSYPIYSIDYSLALVSRGDLPNAISPEAVSTVAGQVNFVWTDNSGVGKAAATDKAILAMYCPDRKQCIYTTLGADRSAESDVMSAPSFSGQQVQTYVGFISADGKNIASSIYTGQVTVL